MMVMMTVTMMHAMVLGVIFGAHTLHMVVMTDLRRAQVVFVTDDLFAVFAQLAIHHARAVQRVFHAPDERVNNPGVVVEV